MFFLKDKLRSVYTGIAHVGGNIHEAAKSLNLMGMIS